MSIEELFEKMQNRSLFVGRYDAKNGDEKFMFGVCTVMEFIANEISEEVYEEFRDKFLRNMLDSENAI